MASFDVELVEEILRITFRGEELISSVEVPYDFLAKILKTQTIEEYIKCVHNQFRFDQRMRAVMENTTASMGSKLDLDFHSNEDTPLGLSFGVWFLEGPVITFSFLDDENDFLYGETFALHSADLSNFTPGRITVLRDGDPGNDLMFFPDGASDCSTPTDVLPNFCFCKIGRGGYPSTDFADAVTSYQESLDLLKTGLLFKIVSFFES